MFKQAKKHFRLECCKRKRKGGLHDELSLTGDVEMAGLFRMRRGKRAVICAGDFDDCSGTSYHYQHDKKSWKSRCRKRHQWEKHFHTDFEKDHCRLFNTPRGANAVLEIARRHAGWVKIDIRNHDEWKRGIDWLVQHRRIESLHENQLSWYSLPLRIIRVIPLRMDENDELATSKGHRRSARHAEKERTGGRRHVLQAQKLRNRSLSPLEYRWDKHLGH